MGSQTTPVYLMKTGGGEGGGGGTENLVLIQETEEIWKFCMSQQITRTAEHLPGIKNTKADQASREIEESSSE